MRVVRPTSQNVREAVEKGYTMIALGLDAVFLDAGITAALEAARAGQ
jgi:hypothetical protein